MFAPRPFDLTVILLHIRVEHDMDVEIATWPDGTPVVVDETLEPDDFGATGEAR